MTRITFPTQGGVSETLLIPLYCRALESQRPDALLRDERAAALVAQIDYDFSRIKLAAHDHVTIVMRQREFDRRARDFLTHNNKAVVVHIGCGLDTRFERVDDGRVEWYDLDLPEVIDLRRQLIDVPSNRCRPLACSIFDPAWIDVLSIQRQRKQPFLFLAEGVLPYFTPEQVRSFVLTLHDQFPGCELIFDGLSPFTVWADNLQLASSKIGARMRWGLKHARELEKWASNIQLLDEWYYLDRPEPRLHSFRWLRYFPPLARSAGIFHYRLG